MTNADLPDNAAYCPGSTVVDGLGLFSAQVVTSANYIEGNLNEPTIDHGRFFNGGSASRAYTNPAGANFWSAQGSILRYLGDVIHGAALDFNNMARTKSISVRA